MAVQSYIGWPTDVNRTILDSTTFTFGENATKSDELENGLKRTVLKGGYNPDKYSVVMTFNWMKKIPHRNNKTEFQLFVDWYKYQHRYGSVPFEFPKLLYASNTGIQVYDKVDEREGVAEYYRIVSATQGKKSGEEVEVNMTWETVYSGSVSIDSPTPEAVGIQASRKYVDVLFSAVSDSAPISNYFTVAIDNVAVGITGFCYDGSRTVRLYYPERAHGSVVVTISNYSGYSATLGPSTF